ncbi:uncharacterized protein DSM5745_02511 [Aspergillus mulundensis]|uniref:Uncharacterized protein n=1 Tax=Aspergillus mulundensis TaxID=1810919 RepID=A0A3D8SWQ4_9EURO|nr:hypothetical protein DSM5745_02511 [Aspergillus mulundensis]RDW90736.1 hypothetical protein DSM5745_02511 [Aspergillus mulundensis]
MSSPPAKAQQHSSNPSRRRKRNRKRFNQPTAQAKQSPFTAPHEPTSSPTSQLSSTTASQSSYSTRSSTESTSTNLTSTSLPIRSLSTFHAHEASSTVSSSKGPTNHSVSVSSCQPPSPTLLLTAFSASQDTTKVSKGRGKGRRGKPKVYSMLRDADDAIHIEKAHDALIEKVGHGTDNKETQPTFDSDKMDALVLRERQQQETEKRQKETEQRQKETEQRQKEIEHYLLVGDYAYNLINCLRAAFLATRTDPTQQFPGLKTLDQKLKIEARRSNGSKQKPNCTKIVKRCNDHLNEKVFKEDIVDIPMVRSALSACLVRNAYAHVNLEGRKARRTARETARVKSRVDADIEKVQGDSEDDEQHRRFMRAYPALSQWLGEQDQKK